MRPARLSFALPAGILSGKRKTLWIVILALSPLAYFGATKLEDRLPHAPRPVMVSKDEMTVRATAFARTLGVDATGWKSSATVNAHPTVARVFEHRRVPALQEVVAPATVQVSLVGSQPGQWINVHLTPGGQVVEFLGPKPATKADAPNPDRLREIATQYLFHRLGASHPFHLQDPTVRNVDKRGWEQEFIWQSDIPGMPEGKIQFHVTAAGNQVVSESRSLDLDPAFLKSTKAKENPLETPLKIFKVLYFVGLGIYAIYRYIRRSLEKEVSHWPAIPMTAIVAAGGVLLFA